MKQEQKKRCKDCGKQLKKDEINLCKKCRKWRDVIENSQHENR